MKKTFFAMLAFALLPACLLAADGQVLISQASVTAAGGFPYTISQPGSYKLTGNLLPPSTADAIHINSNNVTLDLNGFTIGSAACVPGPCTALSGRAITTGSASPFYNITIENGTVSGMSEGVALTGDSFIVQDMHIRNIANYGIGAYAGSSHPTSVIVRRNTIDSCFVGLYVEGGVLVTDNAFSNNGFGTHIGDFESAAATMVIANIFTNNPWGIQIIQGGYSNNSFTGGGPSGGTNFGGNLCLGVVCP